MQPITSSINLETKNKMQNAEVYNRSFSLDQYSKAGT